MAGGEVIMPEFLAVGKSMKAVDEAEAALAETIQNPQSLENPNDHVSTQLATQYARPGASRNAAEIILQELGTRSKSPIIHPGNRKGCLSRFMLDH